MGVELCMVGKNTPNSYIHIDVSVHHDVGVPTNALDLYDPPLTFCGST